MATTMSEALSTSQNKGRCAARFRKQRRSLPPLLAPSEQAGSAAADTSGEIDLLDVGGAECTAAAWAFAVASVQVGPVRVNTYVLLHLNVFTQRGKMRIDGP